MEMEHFAIMYCELNLYICKYEVHILLCKNFRYSYSVASYLDQDFQSYVFCFPLEAVNISQIILKQSKYFRQKGKFIVWVYVYVCVGGAMPMLIYLSSSLFSLKKYYLPSSVISLDLTKSDLLPTRITALLAVQPFSLRRKRASTAFPKDPLSVIEYTTTNASQASS